MRNQKFNPYKIFANDGKALSQWKECPKQACPKCGELVDSFIRHADECKETKEAASTASK